VIKFEVEGTPRPQGSKRHVGNGVMVESSKYVKDWRSYARLKATQTGCERYEKPTALMADVTFIFDRPKKHFKANGELKKDAPFYHTSKPDTEKLMRALLDAVTGVCFHDDSQVSVQHSRKIYGPVATTEVQLLEVIGPVI
jgi:crossover junction endodeoxyribonuclease RusA